MKRLVLLCVLFPALLGAVHSAVHLYNVSDEPVKVEWSASYDQPKSGNRLLTEIISPRSHKKISSYLSSRPVTWITHLKFEDPSFVFIGKQSGERFTTVDRVPTKAVWSLIIDNEASAKNFDDYDLSGLSEQA